VDQSHRFAPLAGDWILTAPSPAAAPYMPKLAPQGILHPTLPAGHAKAQTKAAVSAAAGSISFDQLEKLIGPIAFERYFGRDAGNDTPRGISHR
jgi:hypothetical protein